MVDTPAIAIYTDPRRLHDVADLLGKVRQPRRQDRADILARNHFRDAEAEAALFRYIDGWYNPRRIQAGLDGLSPDEYEQAWQASRPQHEPATLQPEPANPR
jgi:transposase InsO family protein